MKQKITTKHVKQNTECNGEQTEEDSTEKLNHRSASQCHTKVTTSHQSTYFSNHSGVGLQVRQLRLKTFKEKKKGHKIVRIGDQLPRTHLFVAFVFVKAPT